MTKIAKIAIFSKLLIASLLVSGCDQKPKVASTDQNTTEAMAKEEAFSLPDEVSFNEHVQPILSEYCYHCHGPDSETRRPDKEPLRLDSKEGLSQIRDFGTSIMIPGKPAESLLVKLIKSHDEDEVMPPPESHKVMKPREIAMVEKWVAQGAVYEGHWAYEPIKRPTLKTHGWSDHPIDGFILEKLTEAGLQPNQPEEVRRFHRRLAFDLTGLPPDPSETDAFVVAYTKDADAAVAAEADRMLATTASAEHLARHWLDSVRYADTHGIHFDNYRSIWPYRDWVIRAFQQNMPWDEFTKEQIAGDLMNQPTLDQKVATGFNRCLTTTGEGGAVAEEYDAIYAADRVDTVSAVWLGLTASCASCHDHKFDPFSTKEFYQLTAFFRNNTMSSLDGNNAAHPPAIFVPLPEDREAWVNLENQMAETESKIQKRREVAETDFQVWIEQQAAMPYEETVDPSLVIHVPFNEATGQASAAVDGKVLNIDGAVERIDGLFGKATVISNTDINLGDIGHFSREDQVSYGGYLWFEGSPTGAIVAKMDPSQAHRGWDFYLEGGRVGSHVIDAFPAATTKLISSQPLESGKWHHVMITFDGKQPSAKTLTVYIDGKNVSGRSTHTNVGPELSTHVPLRFGSRDRGDAKLNTRVALQDFRFYRRLLSADEISSLSVGRRIHDLVTLPKEQWNKDLKETLFDYYLSSADAPTLTLQKKKKEIISEQDLIRSRGATSLIFEEKQNSKPVAHILIRGLYSSKGDEVTADTPVMLPPMPEGAPKNRLGLAMWLNDPKNPLPARVTMNRLWSYFFGTGIVESIGDFGIMGARPTHPKLLDWLAAEFIDSRWDYRHMIKAIVTSQSYRQAGFITPERLEKDPENRLISRSSRSRLEAEQLRDLALSASGLLVRKAGGPPVKPYQPQGVWSAVAMKESNMKSYQADTGESLYRRSVYTIWKRTAAPPSMEILNAPTREEFCVRRDVTNTPLQALVLMNDPQFFEASRVLAERSIKASSDFTTRLDYMSLRLLNRKLDTEERNGVSRTLDQALTFYQAKPDQGALVIAVGESKADASVPVAELAAWTLVASGLLNLDETITR